jgi:hypothetical protein
MLYYQRYSLCRGITPYSITAVHFVKVYRCHFPIRFPATPPTSYDWAQRESHFTLRLSYQATRNILLSVLVVKVDESQSARDPIHPLPDLPY